MVGAGCVSQIKVLLRAKGLGVDLLSFIRKQWDMKAKKADGVPPLAQLAKLCWFSTHIPQGVLPNTWLSSEGAVLPFPPLPQSPLPPTLKTHIHLFQAPFMPCKPVPKSTISCYALHKILLKGFCWQCLVVSAPKCLLTLKSFSLVTISRGNLLVKSVGIGQSAVRQVFSNSCLQVGGRRFTPAHGF